MTALPGIASSDPRPLTARYFRWAQGDDTGASPQGSILLIGNPTADGTEPTNVVRTAIRSLQDARGRFGNRSEVAWDYWAGLQATIALGDSPPYFGLAVPEGISATPATATWTFFQQSGLAADVQTTVNVDWAGLPTMQTLVNVGDTPDVQAAAAAALVNLDPYVPFTASVGPTTSVSAVTGVSFSRGLLQVAASAFPSAVNGLGFTVTGGGTLPGGLALLTAYWTKNVVFSNAMVGTGVDITAGLYGGGGTLTGTAVILTVTPAVGSPQVTTVNFAGANCASEGAMLTALAAAAGLTGAYQGGTGKDLVLTALQGSTITVSGAAAATLGLTVAATNVVSFQVTSAPGGSALALTGPWAAAVNVSADLSSQLILTAANNGPRGINVVARIRVSYGAPIATRVSGPVLVAGLVSDDVTQACAYLSGTGIQFDWIAASMTALGAVTPTDGGLGELCNLVASQNLPAVGKGQVLVAGLVGTQAQATAVTASAAADIEILKLPHVYHDEYTSGMRAASHAATLRAYYTAYPGENVCGKPAYGPAPFNATDWPSAIDEIADLNSGVTTITFQGQSGNPVIAREIGAYWWIDSTATPDYRAREGHIVLCFFAAWALLFARYVAQRQGGIAADPAPGTRPKKGMMYPSKVASMVERATLDLAGGAGPALYDGKPIFDPSPDVVAAMVASIVVTALADGFYASVNWQAVRHNNKASFDLSQGGPAY